MSLETNKPIERRLVLGGLVISNSTSDTAKCVISTPADHEYATPFTSVHSREAQVGEDNVNISVSQPAILSVIPCMGPSHLFEWQRHCIQRVHRFL